MSVKVRISASDRSELEEIMKAINPIVLKRNYRIKRKPPTVSGDERYIVYVSTKKHSCGQDSDMI